MVKKLFVASLLSTGAAFCLLLMLVALGSLEEHSAVRQAIIFAILCIILSFMAYDRYRSAIEIESEDYDHQLEALRYTQRIDRRTKHLAEVIHCNPTEPTPASEARKNNTETTQN